MRLGFLYALLVGESVHAFVGSLCKSCDETENKSY